MSRPLLPPQQIDALATELLAEFDGPRLRHGFATMLRFYLRLSMTYNLGTRYIWRGRKCGPEGKANVSELWHPAAQDRRPNRLNTAEDSVFYASNHKGAVFDELGLKEGDHIHLTSFQMKQGSKMTATFVGEYTHVYRTGLSIISPEIGRKLNEQFETFPWESGRSLIHMDAFLASVLRDPSAKQKGYAHSQALAHNLFNKADAIFYPSVESENGLNIAINGDTASRILEPLGGSVLKVTHKNIYGIYDFEVIKLNDGFYDNRDLHWVDVDAEKIRKLRLKGPPRGGVKWARRRIRPLTLTPCHSGLTPFTRSAKDLRNPPIFPLTEILAG